MMSDKKRRAAIRALEVYAEELRTEIEHQTATLKRKLEAVEQSIRTLAAQVQLVGVQEPSSPQPIVGIYSGLGPQAAAEKFLQEHPGEFFRPSEVARDLRANGFTVSNPKLATQQVSIALGRAVDKGIAVDGKRDGRRVFTLRDEEKRSQ
jgi:chemotaxis response regulator CheB